MAPVRLRTCSRLVFSLVAVYVGWLWFGSAGAALMWLYAVSQQGFVSGLNVKIWPASQPGLANARQPGRLVWCTRWAVVSAHGAALGGWLLARRVDIVFADEMAPAAYAQLRRHWRDNRASED